MSFGKHRLLLLSKYDKMTSRSIYQTLHRSCQWVPRLLGKSYYSKVVLLGKRAMAMSLQQASRLQHFNLLGLMTEQVMPQIVVMKGRPVQLRLESLAEGCLENQMERRLMVADRTSLKVWKACSSCSLTRIDT
jgi:hypothetical protein